MPEILDTQIIWQQGSCMFVRRWLRGVHPSRGVIVMGYTGFETLEETVVLKPLLKLFVVPK